jgi:hypothetical protein
VESSDDSTNAKNRITESQFQKIDPCTLVSPALLALASRNEEIPNIESDQGRHSESVDGNPGATADNRASSDKGAVLAMLLMKSEKNKRKTREETNERRQQEGEFDKQNDRRHEPESDHQRQVGGGLAMPAIDFRGSVSGTSNDSGNCTTTGSNSGTNSVSGSPRFRSADHRQPMREMEV